MADEPKNQPKQDTPKGHTIPVPTREDVLRDLQKVAKPSRAKRESRPKDEG